MSALSKLVKVLNEFGWDYAQDIYIPAKGKPKPSRYVVYNIVGEKGINFADDAPQDEEVTFQIHMYLPHVDNYIKYKKSLRSLLFQAGFTYPQAVLNITEDITSEDGIRYRHICLETDIQTESEV